ncbi:MAG: hypothetical protein Ct9H300mP8_07440 [Gammaproteobacteria bacterium]|nr:MAG: hypothetical protein Ct9H300mP8_07440 [Gammaproteobacteria bacterium]
MAEQNLSYDDIKGITCHRDRKGVSQPDPDKLAREKTFAELNSLGLQANLAELESIGFTTVKGAISEDLVARARDANFPSDGTEKPAQGRRRLGVWRKFQWRLACSLFAV